MAPIEGRREVPDSEDEPMTSSPTNVSDGDTVKLFSMAPVPSQGAEDVPQEATRSHQATPETVANVNTERTDGLGPNRNIASINIDAFKDDQTDLQPTTTPFQLSTDASNRTADALSSDTAMLPRSGTDDTTPQKDATMANALQIGDEMSRSEVSTEPHTMSVSGTSPTSAKADATLRDERSTLEDADAQSPHAVMNVSTSVNQSTEDLALAGPPVDSSKSPETRNEQVGDLRSNELRASQEGHRPSMTSQDDTRTSIQVTSQNGAKISINDKGDEIDRTAQPFSAHEGLRASTKNSSDTLDAKHAVKPDVISGDTDTVAAEATPRSQEQTKQRRREDDAPLASSSSDTQEDFNNLPVISIPVEEPQPTSATKSSLQAPMAGVASAVAEPNTDTTMDLHTAPGGKVYVQSLEEDQAGQSSFSTDDFTNASTAPTVVENSAPNSGEARLDTLNTTIAGILSGPKNDAITVPTMVPDSSLNLQSNASAQLPAASAVATTAKTKQEITLDELRAQKSAMLASLAALPAIRVLIEENVSSDVDMADGDDEPTDIDIMAAANKIVKDHIKLLHEYNELKDVGQGLMGLIADQRGVRIVEVQEEFGIEAKD